MNIFSCFRTYWLWLLTLFLLFFLFATLPFGGNLWKTIEADVASKANHALQEINIPWATIATQDTGRNINISGQAPSDKLKQKAINTLKKMTDNRGHQVASHVTWNGSIKPPKPIKLEKPHFQISIGDNSAILQGTVADQQQSDALNAAALSHFSPKQVINRLVIGSNIEPLKTGLINQLFNHINLSGVSITLIKDIIKLEGSIDTDAQKKQLTQKLNQQFSSFGYTIVNNLSINPSNASANTKQTTIENKNNCQQKLKKLMSNSTIFFDSSKAIIKPQSYPVLDEIFDILKQCPSAQVVVEGHTDNTGNADFNKKLSKNRAQSVVNYLVKKGIMREKLSEHGFGSSKPVVSNDTPEGRSKNRRIEFTIK